MTHPLSASFARAFQEAGGYSPHTYSELVRFIAVMAVVIAVMGCLRGFLDERAKASEEFMVQTASRLVKIAIGLTIFILFLT